MRKGESKYDVLKAWLQLQRDKNVVEISISELEERLRNYDEKFEFPPSAYKHAAWWSNDHKQHPESKHGWLAAGWKAYPVVEGNKVVRVIFRRG